jgi:alpha-L-rhamnosidase
MKYKNVTLLLFSLFLIFSFQLSVANKKAKDEVLIAKATGLTIESIRQPKSITIIDSRPELGWVLPLEAFVQTAYEVQVASSLYLLDKDTGDVWTSGKVMSNRSSDVEIAVDLNENTTYFWKVRYYDANYQVSEFSDTQQFTTGEFGDKLTSQNFFQSERISPIASEKRADGTVFIDFGKAAFAALEIDYKTTVNDILTIRVGEKLLEGRIDQKPGGTIMYQEVKLAVKPGQTHYKVPIVANERNTNHLAIALPDSFPVLIPYRYAEVLGASKKLDASKAVQVAYFSYFDEASSAFTSSNEVLNQVWDLCKYTIKATTFAGYYVDGERERIPYEADAYLNQLSHYCLDNEYAIARLTIEYFFMSKPTWPTEWQLHVPMLVYQDYMYTGNTEIIAKYYERLKVKSLMELEVEDGFISSKSPKHNVDLIKRLGFPDSTRRLKDIVDWPPKAKNFGGKGPIPGEQDGIGTDHAALHANMILLAFDVVPEARKASVVEYVKSRGMVCSVYGAQYLLEALYKAGEDVYANELMSATSDRSWYNMIKIGSTMTLEAWDMKYKSNGDWNHAWGAAPGNIVARGMWGINPKTPGFGVVSIYPQMGTLTTSSIIVPTIKGQIKGEFEKVNEDLSKYTFELPANMPGELKLNWPENALVKVNGQRVSLAFDSIRLNPGVNTIEISKAIF